MKKNNLLLIGTHNDGKFREISKLISKKIKKNLTKKFKNKGTKGNWKNFQVEL